MVTAPATTAGNPVQMLGPVASVVAVATDIDQVLQAFPWLMVVRVRREVVWPVVSRHGSETRTVRRSERLL